MGQLEALLITRFSCSLTVVGTYDEIVADNITAARARRKLSQRVVAVRMTALGFEWRQQIVAAVESARRGVRIDELFGLALALETSFGALLDPPSDDKQVRLPNGQAIPRGSIMRSVRHFNDGAVTWLSDDRADFGSGTWPWPVDEAGPEAPSDLALGPFLDALPVPIRRQVEALLPKTAGGHG